MAIASRRRPATPLRLATPEAPDIGDRPRLIRTQVVGPRGKGPDQPLNEGLAALVVRIGETAFHEAIKGLERVEFRWRDGPARDRVIERPAEQDGGRPRVLGPRRDPPAKLVIPVLGHLPHHDRRSHAQVVIRTQRRAIPDPGPRHVATPLPP